MCTFQLQHLICTNWLPTAELTYSPVNFCWPSPTQPFLVSGPVVTRDHFSVLSRLLRVMKWSLLFNKRRGLTNTGHSLSNEEWLCWLSLSFNDSLAHSSENLTQTNSQRTIDFFCSLSTDDIENIFPNSSSIITLHSYSTDRVENTASHYCCIFLLLWNCCFCICWGSLYLAMGLYATICMFNVRTQ
jgi:hypothetical protein